MHELIQALAALFAIANPIGAAPVYLGLTAEMDRRDRMRGAARASVAVFVILAVSAVGGNWVLSAFGISFAAFRAAGGLVILLMGLEMLAGSRTRAQRDPGQGAPKDDPVIVPFAMPMIAGPGAITTVITLTARGPGWKVPVLGAVAVLAGSLFVWLWATVKLGARIGKHGHGILLRFLGLILVAMGAQFLLTGLKTFLAAG